MENITLGQIYAVLLFLSGFIGVIIALIVYLKKALTKVIKETTRPINEEVKTLKQKFDDMEKEHMKKLSKLELESTRNDLVNYMTLADKGIVSPKTKEDMHVLYDEYRKNGGNSYIHDEWERLKKEGKL